MNKSLSKAAAIVGLAALTLSAYAHDKGAMGTGSMSGMKMDCMKNMVNMEGMEGMQGMKGMKMDCMGSNSKKKSADVTAMSEGEVKAADKANKSITLKHGHIKSNTVDMAPMTMSFPVKNPSLLSKVKVGNKVKFRVENVNDAATVTALVVQK